MTKMDVARTLFINKYTISMFGSRFRLDIGNELVEALEEQEWQRLKRIPAYFALSRFPVLAQPVELNIPQGSQLVIFDFEFLMTFEDKRERIAIVLHEIGHLFNPGLTGEENEFRADNYVVEKGFGSELRSNLERCISDYPRQFDKGITRKRIKRLEL